MSLTALVEGGGDSCLGVWERVGVTWRGRVRVSLSPWPGRLYLEGQAGWLAGPGQVHGEREASLLWPCACKASAQANSIWKKDMGTRCIGS